MNPIDGYKRWISQEGLDTELHAQLAAIADDDAEIADRFYRDLAFGTGGLRGVMGAGTNRMNRYTVGGATQGLAGYLKETGQDGGVCIAYDTRNMSAEFARIAAEVLAANGIKVYLYNSTRPTPMLSFAVRHKGAAMGIVITASHNPKEYNGYKVYGSDGGQITDLAAQTILSHIQACDIFGVKTMDYQQAVSSGLIAIMGEDTDFPYYERVKALINRPQLVAENAGKLRILYAPLHGSGNLPIRRVLGELGYHDLHVVKEQELPDGNFPTAPYPNPEEPSVFRLAIEQAKTLNPSLIFATDPDCDRIGVLVKNPAGEYQVLTGNQCGILLLDYIIRSKSETGTLPANAAAVTTIVSTGMAKEVCSKNGVHLEETLTGFKYIGEKVGEWEKTGEHSFLFGFEESYGYLAGNFVRDKDAVIASALIAEMALYYSLQSMSLFDALDALYMEYGCHAERLISKTMPGQQGLAQIDNIMSGLRQNYTSIFAGEKITAFEDYLEGVGGLPKSNVLKFHVEGGSWMVLRPSGTEPKIKIYLAAKEETKEALGIRLNALESLIEQVLA